MKREKNGEIYDKREEISDVRVCCGDTADMVSFETLDFVVLLLTDLLLLEIISSLPYMRHVSSKSGE